MRNRAGYTFTISLIAVSMVLLNAVLVGTAMAQSTYTVTIQLDGSTGRNLCVFSTPPSTWGSDHSTSILAFGNYVGPQSGLARQSRSYLWFPMSATIPANATIDTASLELYVRDWPFAGSSAMGAYRVTENWDESFSWGTRPATELTPLSTITIDSNAPGWSTWDVTSVVREWVQDTATNYGFMVSSAPAPDSLVGNGWACAAPGRTSGEAAYSPRLVITYTQASAATEVPEPATVVLVGAGLAGVAGLLAARRRR